MRRIRILIARFIIDIALYHAREARNATMLYPEGTFGRAGGDLHGELANVYKEIALAIAPETSDK